MNLQDVRISKGLSQTELANLSGVNIRTLQSYEQGLKNIDGAKLDTLLNLSSTLNCNISDILESESLKDKCKLVKL